jgi:EAL and modified HD-GYP domain-containing signal transduction protein
MIDHMTDDDVPSVSIMRQPVFDQNRRLWGYDLLCVGNTDNLGSESSEPLTAAACVASGAYIFLQQLLQGGKKVIVDFTEKSLLEKLPYVLPPVRTVIKIDEQASQRQSSIEALNRLKGEGYLIAVQGFTGDPACAPIYRLADILVIEARDKGSDAQGAKIAAARQYRALLLASRVQDRGLYETCRQLGFSIFSGSFFKYPDTMTARKLSSNQVLRFKLLKLIERDDPDITSLAEAIQADATISFRLLAFLNSAAFAFSQKIKSIHQATYLLGWSKIKNWLRVVLLMDMSQSKESEELVLLSAQRGMFLELVARDHNFWGFDPKSLHLLGIFSLLDVLVGLPMTDVVTHLPIDEKMKRALCCEANNEYLPFLRLSQCFEEARWQEAESMVQQLNLDSAKVRVAFQKSMNWAGGLESLGSERAATREMK